MVDTLTARQVRLLRAANQGLLNTNKNEFETPLQVLKSVLAVQAQDYPAARLSIRARGTRLTGSMVEQARLEERSIVWTWLLRGTLHLVATEDLAWMLPLLAPGRIAAQGTRLRQLGWDPPRIEQGLKLLRAALEGQQVLSRAEIASLLESDHLPYQGQATVHLLYRAAMEGILVNGPFREGKPTYVSLENWMGELHPLPEAEALAALASRYLAAYGPAGPHDLASWSGLKVSAARQAWDLIASQVIQVEILDDQGERQPSWLLTEQLPLLENAISDDALRASPDIRLLPRFDTYLLGYQNRRLLIDREYEPRIYPGGGIIAATLLVDGQVQGTWNLVRKKRLLEVWVDAFEPVPDEWYFPIEDEAADVARFLGEPRVAALIGPQGAD